MNQRLALVGASGRMGRLIASHAADFDFILSAAIVGPGNQATQISPDIFTTSKVELNDADIVIDFSTPDACISAVQAAVDANIPFVSGTTGLSIEQEAILRDASTKIPLLHAANFSVGVNVLEHLVELASRSTGTAFDLEVLEAHHKNKVDAPSGTALFLGKAAARGRGHSLNDVATWSRHGHVGARKDEEIGFQVIRGGSVVGEHTVFLLGSGERLELTHRANDRAIFAKGALRAAYWLLSATPGGYSMRDVLFAPNQA